MIPRLATTKARKVQQTCGAGTGKKKGDDDDSYYYNFSTRIIYLEKHKIGLVRVVDFTRSIIDRIPLNKLGLLQWM